MEDPPIAIEGEYAFLDHAPPESLGPTSGAPVFMARSITLQIFSLTASPRIRRRR